MTSSDPSTTIFPQFLADEHGLYRARPTSFLLAFLTQGVGVAVLVAIAAYVTNHPPAIGRRLGAMIEGPISFPFTREKPGGHGGGGTHDKLAASRGALPLMTLEISWHRPKRCFSISAPSCRSHRASWPCRPFPCLRPGP